MDRSPTTSKPTCKPDHRDRVFLTLTIAAGLFAVAVVIGGLFSVNQPPVKQADWPAYRISINSAGQPALQLLPGVGRTIAGYIIAERQSENGFFVDMNDLVARVNGIGSKTAVALQPLICFDRPVESDSPRAEDPLANGR